MLDIDEQYRADTTLERLASLKTVYNTRPSPPAMPPA